MVPSKSQRRASPLSNGSYPQGIKKRSSVPNLLGGANAREAKRKFVARLPIIYEVDPDALTGEVAGLKLTDKDADKPADMVPKSKRYRSFMGAILEVVEEPVLVGHAEREPVRRTTGVLEQLSEPARKADVRRREPAPVTHGAFPQNLDSSVDDISTRMAAQTLEAVPININVDLKFRQAGSHIQLCRTCNTNILPTGDLDSL